MPECRALEGLRDRTPERLGSLSGLLKKELEILRLWVLKRSVELGAVRKNEKVWNLT